MRYGKTLMNSFLFNSSVIVLCAIPVVQFCTYAFDGYARYTTISTLLGVQVKYLKFLSIFFENNIFVYIILVLALLSSVYLSYYHRDKSAEAKQLKAKMKGIKKGGCC
jgi:LMBR1 domain-containing protein 1